MERKIESAMKQMKILNLDFSKDCNMRKTLVEEAIRKIQDKVSICMYMTERNPAV